MHNIEEEVMNTEAEVIEQEGFVIDGTSGHELHITMVETGSILFLQVNQQWQIIGVRENYPSDIAAVVHSALSEHVINVGAHLGDGTVHRTLDLSLDPNTFINNLYAEHSDLTTIVKDNLTIKFFNPVVSRVLMSSDNFEIYVNNMLIDIRKEINYRAEMILEEIREA